MILFITSNVVVTLYNNSDNIIHNVTLQNLINTNELAISSSRLASSMVCSNAYCMVASYNCLFCTCLSSIGSD